MLHAETFLVLGGGGMTGFRVASEIASQLRPCHLVIAGLTRSEAEISVQTLLAEHAPSPADDTLATFEPAWGDIFLRSEWNPDDTGTPIRRAELLKDPASRVKLYDDLFGDFESAYRRSRLVQLVEGHRPDVVIDCINTATAIAYQDVGSASRMARERFATLAEGAGQTGSVDLTALGEVGLALDALIVSQMVPELVRHVLFLRKAMAAAKTRLYLKVGTTGTGGMGMNIPYTHSEDKPSATLMSKSAVGFAHTGLLFLMARTPDSPVVKEVKPGAMIGWRDIGLRSIRRQGRPVQVFASKTEPLGDSLVPRQPEAQYDPLRELRMVVIDTGENGVFSQGEFEAITHVRQMEFITPEGIAQQVVLEIKGSNTGYDVIAAIDSSVMNPTYRAAYLRPFALRALAREQKLLQQRLAGTSEAISPSVAHGQLGPPELGKLLWEAHLLKQICSSVGSALKRTPEELSSKVSALLKRDPELVNHITAVGLPILSEDGKSLIRGPFVRIPEVPEGRAVVATPEQVDQWARKGWVDLRPSNFRLWHQRFEGMRQQSVSLHIKGSAAIRGGAYLVDECLPEALRDDDEVNDVPISIGAVAAWVFIKENAGYRIK